MEELSAFGRKLSRSLSEGAVVALVGDLGAGKTTLTRAIAEGLGVTDPVTSPTFTLINEYGGGRLPLYHFDVNRLGGDLHEMEELGYDDYFFGDGVTVVEWADMIESILPDDTIIIELRHTDDPEKRLISLRTAFPAPG
jgi:tRNA threonylcarbamoyladenosine biosynthesis protein TsaE